MTDADRHTLDAWRSDRLKAALDGWRYVLGNPDPGNPTEITPEQRFTNDLAIIVAVMKGAEIILEAKP